MNRDRFGHIVFGEQYLGLGVPRMQVQVPVGVKPMGGQAPQWLTETRNKMQRWWSQMQESGSSHNIHRTRTNSASAVPLIRET